MATWNYNLKKSSMGKMGWFFVLPQRFFPVVSSIQHAWRRESTALPRRLFAEFFSRSADISTRHEVITSRGIYNCFSSPAFWSRSPCLICLNCLDWQTFQLIITREKQLLSPKNVTLQYTETQWTLHEWLSWAIASFPRATRFKLR